MYFPSAGSCSLSISRNAITSCRTFFSISSNLSRLMVAPTHFSVVPFGTSPFFSNVFSHASSTSYQASNLASRDHIFFISGNVYLGIIVFLRYFIFHEFRQFFFSDKSNMHEVIYYCCRGSINTQDICFLHV